MRDYDSLVETIRSGLVDSETFKEALDNYNKYSDDTVESVLLKANKTYDELKEDVQEWLEFDIEHNDEK